MESKHKIHIWDAIDGDFEVKYSIQECDKYIRANYINQQEGIHPDIESIKLFIQVGQVFVIKNPNSNPETYKVDINYDPLYSYAPEMLEALKEIGNLLEGLRTHDRLDVERTIAAVKIIARESAEKAEGGNT